MDTLPLWPVLYCTLYHCDLFYTAIIKVNFLVPIKLYFCKLCAQNGHKIPESLNKGVKTSKNHGKMVKCITFLVLVYISQDFAQTWQNFTLSHDGETVTFRNSGFILYTLPLWPV